MGTLLSALQGAGLIDEKKAKAEQERRRNSERQDVARGNSKLSSHINDLEFCTTIVDFRRTAKELLLEDPSQIGWVIQQAHRLKDLGIGKRLVWQMYQVRDGLRNCPPDKVTQFLNRSFRKNNQIFDIPQ